MNHREAWAEERRAPSREAWARERTETRERTDAAAVAPKQRKEPAMTPSDESGETSKEVLIVASKLKAYVRARSGMNTSSNVLEALSAKVRDLCDAAIENARTEGRKTVMDRDFR
ncbi:MAG: hypothetical protein KC466_17535, partial [Myxococcales bacterium]|nr:hypothetical protein [Myxococcales bacterium]